jgi:hypothetical protein
MTKPPHPNVRKCTHVKVTGLRCGSPALRGEFFCYFHTRVIKGVQQRADMRLDSIALLEDPEAIQLSLMHVVDGLVKGTLELPRARLIIQALRIAARNAKEVRFEAYDDTGEEPKMVRQVPDYARQYQIEHPESTCGADTLVREPAGAPDLCGAGAIPREAEITTDPCSADTPVREAAKRRKNAAHSASCGAKAENNPAPQERKKPNPLTRIPQSASQSRERELTEQAEAAIEAATNGNWRDLHTVLKLAGISVPNKEAPS